MNIMKLLLESGKADSDLADKSVQKPIVYAVPFHGHLVVNLFELVIPKVSL